MNNKKTSLSNQLIVITLTALLVMIVSIIIVLPKSLEPFFEETVYSYLDQPLQMIEKEDSLTKKYKNIAYIIYSDDRILISEDYKNILGVDDYQKTLSMPDLYSYVMMPSSSSISEAIQKIDEITGSN